MTTNRFYDFIGVGAGVFNLSLAALLETKHYNNYLFIDKKKEFSWHGDTMLNMSEMQTSPLKDLVTPVEPTNRFSFLNYLWERGILYQYFNCNEHPTTRMQFNEYLKWVSKNISAIQFDTSVSSIHYKNKRFYIETETERYETKHIVFGCGISPKYPDCVTTQNSETLHHSSSHLKYKKNYDGRRVVVIGGGQSGAEIFHNVISNSNPASASWFSSRVQISPLEDSCFTNELYTPAYASNFYNLPQKIRSNLNRELLNTSDGITRSLSDAVYNQLFEKKYFHESDTKYIVKMSSRLTKIEKINNAYKIQIMCLLTSNMTTYWADDIILATGYTPAYQGLLHNLTNEYSDLKKVQINDDFSLQWEHGDTNKIFIQNGAKDSHGVSDPNISLAAWRASVIANGLFGEEIYKTQFKSLVEY